MFGLGTVELVIILVILVMIFGLGKLPKAAGKIGEAVGSFQDAVKGEDEDLEIGDEGLDEPDKLDNQETSQAVDDAAMPRQKDNQGERSPDGNATW